MWQSVQNAFLRFTAQFEDVCLWPYLDVKGLVTTGYGNLINTPQDMIAFGNWYHRDKTPATEQEVANEWCAVKALQSRTNASIDYWRDRAVLMLDPVETDKRVMAVVKQVESYIMLRPQFHSYCNWPADAQMAVISMEWAMGNGNMSNYHKFLAAANVNDFLTMAAECYMDDTHNPGLKPRNRANTQMLLNAHAVIALGINPSNYYGPSLNPFVLPVPPPAIITST